MNAFLLSLVLLSQDGGGALDVVYEPKKCVVAPCPQFKVVAINGEAVSEAIGADIKSIEGRRLSTSQTIRVVGSWKREGNYLNVEAKEISRGVTYYTRETIAPVVIEPTLKENKNANTP